MVVDWNKYVDDMVKGESELKHIFKKTADELSKYYTKYVEGINAANTMAPLTPEHRKLRSLLRETSSKVDTLHSVVTPPTHRHNVYVMPISSQPVPSLPSPALSTAPSNFVTSERLYICQKCGHSKNSPEMKLLHPGKSSCIVTDKRVPCPGCNS